MKELFIPTRNKLRLKTYIYNDASPSDTAIIVCHGFSGSSSGVFYPQLCELLSKKHFVLRFDFRGQGMSDGDFYDSCLSIEIEDLESVFKYVEKNYRYKNIVLLGHSFGAAVSFLFATEYQDKIAGLISVSGEGDLKKAIEIEFSDDELKALRENGEVEIVNWSKDGEKELIGTKHLEDIKKFSTLEAVGKLNIPTLFIHGDKDEVIPVSRTKEMYQITSSPKQITIISGANHVYNFYEEDSLINNLFTTIDAWLTKSIG